VRRQRPLVDRTEVLPTPLASSFNIAVRQPDGWTAERWSPRPRSFATARRTCGTARRNSVPLTGTWRTMEPNPAPEPRCAPLTATATATESVSAPAPATAAAARSVARSDVLRDLARTLLRILGEDIILDVVTAPDTPRVRADRTQLEQVILNLAVNSRDPGSAAASQFRPAPTRNCACATPGKASRSACSRASSTRFCHEGTRERHRPRTVQRLRHCQTERRLHHGRKPGRPRLRVHDLPARGQTAGPLITRTRCALARIAPSPGDVAHGQQPGA